MKQEKTESSTPFDDVFRTLVTKGGNLIIPLINEMFSSDTPMPLDAPVTSLSNELYADTGGGQQNKLITDSFLHVGGKTYHLECQSRDDGAILLRMMQYDTLIALQESVYNDYSIRVKMPRSGVLFLRTTNKTPDHLKVILETPGGEISYSLAAQRLADYTLEDIISKKLVFLMPFYLLNLERELPAYEKGVPQARQDVVGSLDEILETLESSSEKQELGIGQYFLVTNMLKKITDHVAGHFVQVRKELDAIMGGKILEFKGEKLYRKALKEGIEQGIEQGMAQGMEQGEKKGKAEGKAEGKVLELAGLVNDGALPEEFALKRAKEKYGVSAEQFKELMASAGVEDERMQG